MAKKELTRYDEYVALIRLFFSSLTARRSRLLYSFGNADANHANRYILSNASEKLLMTYNEGMSALHVIDITCPHLQLLMDEFFITPTGDYPLFQINTANYVTDLNKYKYPLELRYDQELQRLSYNLISTDTLAPDETINTTTTVQIGEPIHNFYASVVMNYMLETIMSHNKKSDTASAQMEVDLKKYTFSNNELFVEIDLDDLVDTTTGNKIFNHHKKKLYLHLYEGIDTISSKEFIKRIKDEEYTYKLHIWTVDEYIKYKTVLKTDKYTVTSMRPNVSVFPTYEYDMLDLSSLQSTKK